MMLTTCDHTLNHCQNTSIHSCSNNFLPNTSIIHQQQCFPHSYSRRSKGTIELSFKSFSNKSTNIRHVIRKIKVDVIPCRLSAEWQGRWTGWPFGHCLWVGTRTSQERLVQGCPHREEHLCPHSKIFSQGNRQLALSGIPPQASWPDIKSMKVINCIR